MNIYTYFFIIILTQEKVARSSGCGPSLFLQEIYGYFGRVVLSDNVPYISLEAVVYEC